MAESFALDAHSPKEVAARVSEVGAAGARLPLLTLTLLGLLAGAFTSLGALMLALVAGVYRVIDLRPAAANGQE